MNLINRYDIDSKPIKIAVCTNCGHEVRVDNIPDEILGIGKINPLTMIRGYMNNRCDQSCCEKPRYRYVLSGRYK